jgi:hypothetical protein
MLSIPADIEAGRYRLVSGLYDASNGMRVQLEDGGDAVELGTITVVTP